MQKSSAASCAGGVNSNTVGAGSSREGGRTDSSFLSSNFTLNSRRSQQIIPYKIKSEKEPLSNRLGPPDFYPQSSNCPEESLNKEVLQFGYRETVNGLEESHAITATFLGNLSKHVVIRCKESIRRRLRAINETRALKRKAGQVYGVPLSASLLTKSGVFPELQACGEDRKKWVEGLSQSHKRLRVLADHVPQGYRKKSLFEVLIKHNVPVLRATWFIKVNYLNQVRPTLNGVSPGGADKPQITRTELWTKDVIEYLQYLLDEMLRNEAQKSMPHARDQSPSGLFTGFVQQKGMESIPVTSDGEEPSLQFKWWYMVRILRWHYSEGLLFPSHITEWVLNQLQEKQSLEALQLLLPIVFDLIEIIALSQSYVRIFGDMAIRFLQEQPTVNPPAAGVSQKASIAHMLVELLRYLIITVPDTFVSLDYFPLPSSVFLNLEGDNSSMVLASENGESLQFDAKSCNMKVEDAYHQQWSFNRTVFSIQNRAANLAKAAFSGFQGHGEARVAQVLDKALMNGDAMGAYDFLSENLCHEGVAEGWIAEISPCLRSCLKLIGSMSIPEICSVFFLLEWATCDFRDFRSFSPLDMKFTGTRDFSQIHFAVSILKWKVKGMNNSSEIKNGCLIDEGVSGKKAKPHETHSRRAAITRCTTQKTDSSCSSVDFRKTDIFSSPGPLHAIVVSWLDQHEMRKGEGIKRVQVLIMELIRCGIFYPQVYVRQLIVSGIMDRNMALMYADRQKRHTSILKQLPAPYLIYALEEADIADTSLLSQVINTYSNERRLVLNGIMGRVPKTSLTGGVGLNLFQHNNQQSSLTTGKDGAVGAQCHNLKNSQALGNSSFSKNSKFKDRVPELKEAISFLLHFPDSFAALMDKTQCTNLVVSGATIGSHDTRNDTAEGTLGCEECRGLKRQKLSEERNPHAFGFSQYMSDDEDTWWVQKGSKLLESNQIDQSFKTAKQPSRGRQKVVRKTQSLAQIAANRIEGSQGASPSHVCDHRIDCLNHRNGMGNGSSKERTLSNHAYDIVVVGKTLKKLHLLERRAITRWLTAAIRELLDAKIEYGAGSLSSAENEKSVTRWKLTEVGLFNIVYLLDVSSDLVSIVRLLLWLLPKALVGPNLAAYGGRNASGLPKGGLCEVGEGFILSSLQRYEKVVLAADLLPEALNAAIQRAAMSMPSNGRIPSSVSFSYARSLLKKYGSLAIISDWEQNFKATSDQKLLNVFEAARSTVDSAEVGTPTGVDDDEYFRQKVIGRLPRVSPGMKEIVQRHLGDAINYIYGKERRLLVPGSAQTSVSERWDDVNQTAQHIVSNLMDYIRQNGGAAQEGDPAFVAAAVSALVGSIGIAAVNVLEASGTNNPDSPSTMSSFAVNCVQRIILLHVRCLCLLKDNVNERHSRVFETALTTEASAAVADSFMEGKTSRSQFQLSSDNAANTSNLSNDINTPTKGFVGRSTKVAAAVSALIVSLVLHGVISLERMLSIMKIKERLDVIQSIKPVRVGSNGISRSVGVFKVDNNIEVCLHWFRLLIGNCQTVLDGLVAEFLGEPSVLALFRMQQMLPLNLVFPPAYSIFALVVWKPYILNGSMVSREDIQLYNTLSLAIGDAIKHQPFRDACLRDTHVLYTLLASDASDSEFAALLEQQNMDKQSRTRAFVPLRARLFLNAILDSKIPHVENFQGNAPTPWSHGYGETKLHSENVEKHVNQLVHVLDTLQPAKFHWQWLELRLLLNEQVLIEKIDSHNFSLAEAIRYLSSNADKSSRSENEKNFTEVVLTRLLVRPDAAPLYSEVVHLLGKSLEDSMLMNTKWFLLGNDVLLGRKSIRQRLRSIAENKNLSTRLQFWRPWGWGSSTSGAPGHKRRLESSSLEEGEVVDETLDVKKTVNQLSQGGNMETFHPSRHITTEKALAELMIPGLDRSSIEFRNSFAMDLIKQMITIEQQIDQICHGAGKQVAGSTSGLDASNKGSARKGPRGSSPGQGRRTSGAVDTSPSSASSLRSSMRLRMQFLMRLLPIIYADRDSSNRNMRYMLASVLLRLLGSRVVYEDADFYLSNTQRNKREVESPTEQWTGSSLSTTGESLFDCFLCVLHGLLSSYRPNWLKHKPTSESTKSPRDFPAFDREMTEALQGILDNMQLPASVRVRLQAAMPVMPLSLPTFMTSQLPIVLPSAPFPPLQSANNPSSGTPSGVHQRDQTPASRPMAAAISSGKTKLSPLQDTELDIDSWTFLEDGTGSGCTSNNGSVGVGGPSSNLKACSWLRGATRVRRTDLTYVGTIDEDT